MSNIYLCSCILLIHVVSMIIVKSFQCHLCEKTYVVFSKSALRGYLPLTLLIIRNSMDPGLLQARRWSMTIIKCRRTSVHDHMYVRVASYLQSAFAVSN